MNMEHQISYPFGYRFCPTDEELVIYYLVKKIKNEPISSIVPLKECDLYATEPWEIWKSFGGDNLFTEIDMDEGLFFFSRLKQRSPKDSRISRSVCSGRWHEDLANLILSTDGKKLPIGLKKRFFYKNKNSSHHGRWMMHEISLLDNSSDYVLCQLRKNGKRKLSGFEAEQEGISNDNGVNVRKRQRLISDKNQGGEQPSVETLETYEAKATSVCNETSLDHTVGNSKAVTNLTDDFDFDEIMELLNKEESLIGETNTYESMEINLLPPIGDSEVIVSGRSNNAETEICASHSLPGTTSQWQPTLSSESLSFIDNSVFSPVDEVLEYFDREKVMGQLVPSEEQPKIASVSQASLAFDKGTSYVEAAEERCDSALTSLNWTTPQSPLLCSSTRPTDAFLPVDSCDTNADYSTDWAQWFAEVPEHEYLLQEKDIFPTGFYSESCKGY